MRRVAVLLVLGGCWTKPPVPDVPIDAPPPDIPGGCVPSAPSAPGMTLNQARDEITIQPGMTLAFADETTTVPMPTRLTLNDVDFLGTRESCSIEDQAGIAMYPSFQMSPGAGVLTTPVHSLLRMVTGPAYSQFRINWRRNFTCDSATTAEGETYFSVFPDGRIVRNDMVLPSNSSSPILGTNCACTGAAGDNFKVTSFYAFERSLLARFARINQPFEPTFPTGIVLGQPGGCFSLANGGAVALYWDFVNGEIPQMAPTRLRIGINSTPNPDHEVFAFVYDLHDGSIQAGLNVGVRTTMLLDATAADCMPLSNRTVAKADQPAIRISPVGAADSLVIASGFGLYFDPTPHDGPVTITPGPAGMVPAGFAVTMFLPGTAIATNRPAGDVVWQREADGRFYIWFRGGLSGTDSITITPEC